MQRTPIHFHAMPRTLRPAAVPQGDPDAAVVGQILDLALELRGMQAKLSNGFTLLDQALAMLNQVKHGPPGLAGKPGKDGKSVSAAEVEAAVQKYMRQPKDGQSPAPEAVAEAVIRSDAFAQLVKKHLKPGKDGITPAVDAVVSQALEQLRKRKLTLSDIEGLDARFNEMRGHINASKEWRGGGDTIVAGAGITISNTVNGNRRITATAAGLSVIAVSGTIDDSNTSFTAASQPTLLNINGAFYQKTDGAITWTYVAGTITLSAPVGTGGSIYGI